MNQVIITRRADKGVNELEQEIAALENRANPPQENNTPSVEDSENDVPSTVEEKTYKKRYGDLRRHSQKQVDELKAQIVKLENQLTSSASRTNLPTDPVKVKEWMEKYPQVVDVIRSITDEHSEQKSKELKNKITEIETISSKLARDREEAKIRNHHSDFDEVINQDVFHDWAESQPRAIQNMIYDGDADDVIAAINIYKSVKNVKSLDKEVAKGYSSKTKSPSVGNNGKGRFTESMVQKMSLKQYADNEEAILDAMRDGSFVYDLTGAAR